MHSTVYFTQLSLPWQVAQILEERIETEQQNISSDKTKVKFVFSSQCTFILPTSLLKDFFFLFGQFQDSQQHCTGLAPGSDAEILHMQVSFCPLEEH